MKTQFYLKIASKSFFAPSLYLLLKHGSRFPDLEAILEGGILKWYNEIMNALSNADYVWFPVLYFLNMLYVFIRTDFSQYVSNLYKMNVGFEIESVNQYAREINSMYSPFRGQINKFELDPIAKSLRQIDAKIHQHLHLDTDINLFTDERYRQKIRATCELPLAIRRIHSRLHRYRLKKSETMLHFEYPEKPRLLFQSYIKLKESHNIDLFDFQINILKGILNGGSFLISPAYEQIIVEDINSKGDKQVTIELVCFVPFRFFPTIAIDRVLYCFQDDNKYYPLCYARLEPI